MNNLRTLKWATILVPTIIVWGFETLRHTIFVEADPMIIGNVIMAFLVFIVIYFFMWFIFASIEKLQRENIRHNQDVAILEERERIAREMHDGFAQMLGYVNAKTQAARQLLASNQAKQAEDNLKELEEVARDAYTDVREVIMQLRTTDPFKKDFIPLLREYIARFNQISGVKTELEVDEALEDCFSQNAELQIIRIIQEALTNIRKHSRANHAWVRICKRNGHCEIVIEDDGRGLDSPVTREDNRPRFGLQIMKERAESIKGNLDVTSIPGKGTRVTLIIPLDRKVAA